MKRKTSTSRFRRGLQALSRWCQINRHQPLATQHQTLSQKLMGHFAYYGITGNSSGAGPIPERSQRNMEALAFSSQTGPSDALGPILSLAGALPASAGDSDPLSVPSVAKT